MLPLRYARRWQVASLIILLLVLVATLMPTVWFWDERFKALARFEGVDKWVHGITFLLLSLWFTGLYHKRYFWKIGIGLLLFGIKYSLLLAVFAAVMSLVPIFGTIISSIPIALVALVSGEQGLALGPALAMLAWIAGIHLLESNVLNPKIIGDSAHMHPVVVILALLAGEHVYGLAGALLAVPVASMVQTVFIYLRERVAARAAEESS